MEINNFNEKFFEIGKKYSVNQIDKNGDGVISEEEVLSLAYQDTDLTAELNENDLELVKSSMKDNVTKQVSQISAKPKRKLKSMDEYTEFLDNKFDVLLEKYENKDDIIQYVKNNLREFADIDGDGVITEIDITIIRKYLNSLKPTSKQNIIKASAAKIINQTEVTDNSYLYTLEDIEDMKKLGINISSKILFNLNYNELLSIDNWENKIKEYVNNDKTLLALIKKLSTKTQQSSNNTSLDYKNIIQKGMRNLNSIDDVISYIEKGCDKDAKNALNIACSEIEKYKKYSYEKTNPYNTAGLKINGMGFAWMGTTVTDAYNGYLDGSWKGITEYELKTASIDRMKEIYNDTYEHVKPQNTYLHYIKNADLPKEQLMEILNKINSSSVSVQSQLVEIKEAIEEKLKNLS